MLADHSSTTSYILPILSHVDSLTAIHEHRHPFPGEVKCSQNQVLPVLSLNLERDFQSTLAEYLKAYRSFKVPCLAEEDPLVKICLILPKSLQPP